VPRFPQNELGPEFLQGIRYGIRILSRTPVITAVAILSLALGIGANSTIFSLIDTVVLRMSPSGTSKNWCS
jgi:choline-glycine betaine transporter